VRAKSPYRSTRRCADSFSGVTFPPGVGVVMGRCLTHRGEGDGMPKYRPRLGSLPTGPLDSIANPTAAVKAFAMSRFTRIGRFAPRDIAKTGKAFACASGSR